MHDPMTVAFEIKRPWRERPSKLWPKGYRPTWITIWHVDPENDGSDDSCGWSYPRITEIDRKHAQEIVEHDRKFPYLFNRPRQVNNPEYPSLESIGPGDCAALIHEIWRQVRWWEERKPMTTRLMLRALEYGIGTNDSFQHSFCPERPDDELRCVTYVIRAYRRETRSWYRHPRWHWWHWKIQVHPLQDLKRWLFSRCAKCGKRFPWSYAPVTTSWHGKGPQWFRGEPHLYHHQCAP
jgi:hypothetical protein